MLPDDVAPGAAVLSLSASHWRLWAHKGQDIVVQDQVLSVITMRRAFLLAVPGDKESAWHWASCMRHVVGGKCLVRVGACPEPSFHGGLSEDGSKGRGCCVAWGGPGRGQGAEGRGLTVLHYRQALQAANKPLFTQRGQPRVRLHGAR